MIRYALRCGLNHEFEAWFASSAAYDDQSAQGLVECPICGDRNVRKQIMAPALAKGARPPAGAETPKPPAPAGSEAQPPSSPPSSPPPPSTHAPNDAEVAARQTAFAELAGRVRDYIAQTHDYVGDRFSEEARAMHDGAREHRPIYGEATAEEARALKEEGAPVAPLPSVFAPTPPKKLN